MLGQFPVATMIPAVDLERAKKFYGQTLGLTLTDMGDATNLMFAAGGGTLIGVYQRGTPTQADHTVASWLVDDIEAVVRDLTARGIQFEQYNFPGLQTDAMGIADLGGERAAWFLDPEGNILALGELK